MSREKVCVKFTVLCLLFLESRLDQTSEYQARARFVWPLQRRRTLIIINCGLSRKPDRFRFHLRRSLIRLGSKFYQLPDEIQAHEIISGTSTCDVEWNDVSTWFRWRIKMDGQKHCLQRCYFEQRVVLWNIIKFDCSNVITSDSAQFWLIDIRDNDTLDRDGACRLTLFLYKIGCICNTGSTHVTHVSITPTLTTRYNGIIGQLCH